MSAKKTIALALAMMLLIAGFTACNKGSSDSSKKGSESGTPNASNVSKNTIFAFYNKVQIGQTKDEVNAELGVTGKESTQLKNSFSYVSEDTGYGVEVLFGDDNKATAKTLFYPERKAIAFLCSKPVTQAQADKITKGTTYEQVKSMLGGEGIEINTTQIAFDNNKLSYIRIWVNKDGSLLQVVFGTNGNTSNAMFFDA
jgi:outer membrane protein assembly factor BamE (lipoprotein component of BamABCDE complex)